MTSMFGTQQEGIVEQRELITSAQHTDIEAVSVGFANKHATVV